MSLMTSVAAVGATPTRLSVLALGVVVLVWSSVDLWRSPAYTTASKVGWQLVIGAFTFGPLLSFDGGWSIGFPLGALVYVLLAEHGPLRRRLASVGQSEADRPRVTPDSAAR